MRPTPSLAKRLGIALASGALVLAGTTAASAWSSVTTLSTTITQPLQPRMVVNSKGAAAVEWAQSYNGSWNLKLRVRSAAGTWSATRSIASAVGAYQVAIDAAGNTYLMWDGVQGNGTVRVLSASGSLSAVTSFPHASNGAGFNPLGVVAGPSGVAYVFGWGTESRNYGQVEVRRIDAAGHVGPAQYLSALPDSQVSIDSVSAGIDSAGRLTAAWVEVQPTQSYKGLVKARQLSTDGTPGPIVQISTSGVPAWGPQVAIKTGGGGLVGWTDTKQRFRRLSAAGAFSASSTAVRSGEADLAINNNGTVAATWQSSSPTGADSVYVRTVSSTGTLGVPHQLASSRIGILADTAIDSTGRTLTIMCIGSCDDNSSSIKVGAVSYGGSPGPLTTLTTSSHAGGAAAFVPSLGKFRIVWNSGSRLLTKIGP